MQTRLQLLHEWSRQLQQLLPDLRVTRVRVLALWSLGLLWAEAVAMPRVAAALPLAATDSSTERRLRRWLANDQVDVASTWDPLARALLAQHAGRELLLVFDPTSQTTTATILTLGLVVQRRALPLAWAVLPGQDAWDTAQIDLLARLCQRVARLLPSGVQVTLLADRGLASAELFDLCQALGWHVVMRLSVDAKQGVHARLANGWQGPLWELVPGKRRRWTGQVEVFKQAGWRAGWVTSTWPRRYAQPWILFSDRPGGPARVREYRCRTRIEATFEDLKTRGWDVEASKVTDLARLDRLLLALVLALWWAELLGDRVVRTGLRRRFDRPDRRELAVARLGRRWLTWLLDRGHLPPLPFRFHAAAWTCRWAF